jgi:hypothetical protein
MRTDPEIAMASASVAVHAIQIRDLRLRFGDPDVFAAECSCGWRGEERHAGNPERAARRDGAEHLERATGVVTGRRFRRR